ncbi:MAG: carboxymuconolactone decarboxylase family protein [Alphaproteobacteria bacterium]|nr:carboxymuconolactone decarboxylase family protein [Alphaproteobacteria bacterium]
MPEAKARIALLEEAQWDGETRDLLEKTRQQDGRIFNIFRTLARHPKLLKRWMPFANHILFKNTVSFREREILILRIGWLCQAEYEWAQHVLFARRAGLSDAEIERIKQGAQAPGWNERERLLLTATDELRRDACIGQATWQALKQHYSAEQLMDIVFTVGQYNMVSMALNTLGVELDDGLVGFRGR